MKLVAQIVTAAVLTAAITTPALARDERLHLPIDEAVKSAGGRIDEGVKLFWDKQSYPQNARLYGTYTSNKKTNFFNKSDKEACEWVWLSAVLALQERAKKEGGNAVVDIHSVYRNQEFRSQTEYECGAGSVTGGVALRGTVVKLP